MKKLIILMLIFSSCGVRKSNVNIDDKKTETATVATVQNDVTTTAKTNIVENKVIDSTSNVVAEKITYSPLDNTKPATFTDDSGKVQTLNNVSFTKEKTTAKTVKKSTQTAKVDAVIESKDLGTQKMAVVSKEQDHKKTKQTFNLPLWWLWFLLLIPIGYFAWKYSNRLV